VDTAEEPATGDWTTRPVCPQFLVRQWPPPPADTGSGL